MSFTLFRIKRLLLAGAIPAILPMMVSAAETFPSRPVRIIAKAVASPALQERLKRWS